jgi:hypothetical protein
MLHHISCIVTMVSVHVLYRDSGMRERIFEKHWPATLNMFLSWHCRSSHRSIWRWQSSRTWHRHNTEIRIFILLYSRGHIFTPEHSIHGVCHNFFPQRLRFISEFDWYNIFRVTVYSFCHGDSAPMSNVVTKAQYDNSKRIPLINNNINNYALKAVNVQTTKANRERRYSPTHSWTRHWMEKWSALRHNRFTPGKDTTPPPRHPPYRRLDGPQSLCGDLEKDTKVLTVPRIKRLLSSPARRYSMFRRVSAPNY